jgi:ABC-2 type transport system permease protein
MREAILVTGRILRGATTSAFADWRAIYTWRTWTFAWLVRILAQVIFFAMIGRLLGSEDQVRYLLVGNAVMVAAMSAMMVVPSTTWERRAGTLPLLVAAPGSLVTVYLGRSVQWLPDGLLTSTVAFFGVGALFGLGFPMPRAFLVPLLVLTIAFATYCFGATLGGFVLRAMGARNLVSNAAYVSMMAICGVNVPVAFWPEWVQRLASVLPLTHGLGAVRDLLDGAAMGVVLAGAAREGVVGLGWLVVAIVIFERLARSGRKDGSIEFAD